MSRTAIRKANGKLPRAPTLNKSRSVGRGGGIVPAPPYISNVLLAREYSHRKKNIFGLRLRYLVLI